MYTSQLHHSGSRRILVFTGQVHNGRGKRGTYLLRLNFSIPVQFVTSQLHHLGEG